MASSVSITGSIYVDSLLTLAYTYTDSESNPEGVSTFKWLSNAVLTDSVRQYYLLSRADLYYLIGASVIPVAAFGRSPGAEVYAANVGVVEQNKGIKTKYGGYIMTKAGQIILTQ